MKRDGEEEDVQSETRNSCCAKLKWPVVCLTLIWLNFLNRRASMQCVDFSHLTMKVSMKLVDLCVGDKEILGFFRTPQRLPHRESFLIALFATV